MINNIWPDFSRSFIQYVVTNISTAILSVFHRNQPIILVNVVTNGLHVSELDQLFLAKNAVSFNLSVFRMVLFLFGIFRKCVCDDFLWQLNDKMDEIRIWIANSPQGRGLLPRLWQRLGFFKLFKKNSPI